MRKTKDQIRIENTAKIAFNGRFPEFNKKVQTCCEEIGKELDIKLGSNPLSFSNLERMEKINACIDKHGLQKQLIYDILDLH
jgi:hypothetical protein